MNGLAAVAVALAVVSILAVGTLAWMHRLATLAEREHQQAIKDAEDARRQEAYAKIATDGRSVDGTAGVLDDGKFFVSPCQGVHSGGTEGCSGGDTQG